MEKYSTFFSSYNTAVEAAYNDFLERDGNPDRRNGEIDGDPSDYVSRHYGLWLSTLNEELGGMTPEEYMESVNSPQALAEMFISGAILCDDILPAIFLDKLKGLGDGAIELLTGIVKKYGFDSTKEPSQAAVMAIKVLGSWRAEKAASLLVRLLETQCGDGSELMCETVRDALVSIGATAIDCIIGALESEQHCDESAEYLLMALSDIGSKCPEEKIYRQLKKSFSDMDKKLIPAVCLGNYGDGRAIPAMRGFLEKNKGKLDRETYYETVSAVKKLGGRIDDLNLI